MKRFIKSVKGEGGGKEEDTAPNPILLLYQFLNQQGIKQYTINRNWSETKLLYLQSY